MYILKTILTLVNISFTSRTALSKNKIKNKSDQTDLDFDVTL